MKNQIYHKAISLSEFDMHHVLEIAQHIICIVDKHGMVRYINKAGLNTWGYRAEEMVGKNFLDFIMPEDSLRLQKIIMGSTTGPDISFLINTIVKKDRSLAGVEWLNTWDENKEWLMGIGWSVKEGEVSQLRTNNLVQHLEKFYPAFSNILERITDGFYAVDNNFNVTYWNRKSEELLGVKRENILGKKVWDVLPKEVVGLIYKQQHQAMMEQRKQQYETFMRHDNSWYSINTYPSADGLSVLFKNIDQRKKLEQQLHDELKERQKMITIAVLKAEEKVRSHIGLELHDNINQVLTSVKLLTETYMESGEQDRSMLKKSVDHLNYCIQEIRSLSKQLSDPSVDNFCFHDSISDLVELFHLTHHLNIDLHTVGLQPDSVNTDIHIALYRIVQEQLSNILKHAESTAVVITVTVVRKEKITLLIEDNGKGFDLKSRSKGVGLLNMNSRVDVLNGTLRIETAPGKGCRLMVEVPLHEPAG